MVLFELRDAGFFFGQFAREQVASLRAAEQFRRLQIMQAVKRFLNAIERGKVATQLFQIGAMIAQHPPHHIAHEILGHRDDFVQIRERDFRFDHPELGQVPAGLGFFRTERRAETVHLAVGHAGRLDIQLPGLGQRDRLAEIVHLEQGGFTLARGRANSGVSMSTYPLRLK
jgi:hypothetical protein